MCEDKPGRPSDRTLRPSGRPRPAIGRPAPQTRPRPDPQRRRAGLRRHRPSPARVRFRAPVAADRARTDRAPVPPAARPVRVQPAPARRRPRPGGRSGVAGPPDPVLARPAAADGRHPAALRRLPHHRAPLRAGRDRRLRHGQVPPRLLLGSQAHADHHPEGAVCSFSVAHPKELDERKQAIHLLHARPPAPGPCPIVCDKGFAGAGVEKTAAGLGHLLIRPVRQDEPEPPVKVFPAWLRQRIEAVIWTLKNQLGLERHAARTTEGLWTRLCQRICALNAVIWHNWLIGAPVKRSLIAYDH
ncbi:transposase [Actinomadura sp. WMMB 499]|uniref:transposase n=1 Tax=Actinomadura sp. WMMB 499 TaxID=1219491 RepID=UPI0034A0BAB1